MKFVPTCVRVDACSKQAVGSGFNREISSLKQMQTSSSHFFYGIRLLINATLDDQLIVSRFRSGGGIFVYVYDLLFTTIYKSLINFRNYGEDSTESFISIISLHL